MTATPVYNNEIPVNDCGLILFNYDLTANSQLKGVAKPMGRDGSSESRAEATFGGEFLNVLLLSVNKAVCNKNA